MKSDQSESSMESKVQSESFMSFQESAKDLNNSKETLDKDDAGLSESKQ